MSATRELNLERIRVAVADIHRGCRVSRVTAQVHGHFFAVHSGVSQQ